MRRAIILVSTVLAPMAFVWLILFHGFHYWDHTPMEIHIKDRLWKRVFFTR